METLAALGLAGNVVQFIQFATQIVTTSTEIAESQRGALKTSEEIEDIYLKLSTLSHYLVAQHGDEKVLQTTTKFVALNGPLPGTEDINQRDIHAHAQALQGLSKDCAILCNELLETVRGLRVQPGSSRQFGSFRAALKCTWNSKKIKDLEDRLRRYREAISIHFFPLLVSQQKLTQQLLENLRDESLRLRLDQTSQFDSLVCRLENLKTSLLPSASPESQPSKDPTTARMLNHDIVSCDVDVLEEGIAALRLTTRDLDKIERQQSFVCGLDFPRRPQRHEDIPPAHRKTFQWIFEKSDETEENSGRDQSRLYDWLKTGQGVFWVSGKAGAGKSTLMKFIADHNETRKALEVWASPRTLVLGSHYFWTAGSEMQKSQLGLFQTLLHEIFCACPELISLVCPSRWAQTADANSYYEKQAARHPKSNANGMTSSPPWSNQELLETLQSLSQLTTMPAKFCLFIDGLDEFCGNHSELSHTLKKLAESPNFKLCLSSRPWNVFEDAFGHGTVENKLCINELTWNDIRDYAYERLLENPRWFAEEFPQKEMEDLVNDITEKAQGVFLWVFLVTRSLHQGLVNGDTMTDLQKRLETLPTELEAFFKHMIDLIEPFYHQKMARILQIATNAQGSLDLQLYQAMEYEEKDNEYAICKPIESRTLLKLKKGLKQWRRRINAQCGGLLEIKARGEGFHVEFLHRTARDLLLTRDMSDYLSTRSGQGFMVNLSTLKGFVFLYRCWVQTDRIPYQGDHEPFWRDGLEYANMAIYESKENALALLDAVENLHASIRATENNPHWNSTPFRLELVEAGIDRYVAAKLTEDPRYFDHDFDMALYRAIHPVQLRDGYSHHKLWSQGHIDIIVMLLQSGHDPNSGNVNSSWHEFLRRACTNGEDFKDSMENSLFYHFLKHGARGDTRLQLRMSSNGAYEDRLPFAHFIMALFWIDLSHRFASHCLEIVDYFLEGTTAATIMQLEDLREQIIIRLMDSKSPISNPVRTKFFAQIMQKIITRSIQVTVNMESLIPTIETFFPRNHGAALVDLARRKGYSPLYRQKDISLKREREEEEEYETDTTAAPRKRKRKKKDKKRTKSG
ncbi:hypothetical protein QBC41DRAFT_348200 [Cercophora samala]|uniref:NACHT domain-containing protein n=1 Tax=Cercophora samala TaxID=330535 RepID=A0AA40D8H7_9PEZI|nr:hypothetical protein QBC41DRAFT_348200 [Cercophora samala]